MRISDWSSDVCSSDLDRGVRLQRRKWRGPRIGTPRRAQQGPQLSRGSGCNCRWQPSGQGQAHRGHQGRACGSDRATDMTAAPDIYRGWTIHQGRWPEPAWSAVSPNYDAWTEGRSEERTT